MTTCLMMIKYLYSTYVFNIYGSKFRDLGKGKLFSFHAHLSCRGVMMEKLCRTRNASYWSGVGLTLTVQHQPQMVIAKNIAATFFQTVSVYVVLLTALP